MKTKIGLVLAAVALVASVTAIALSVSSKGGISPAKAGAQIVAYFNAKGGEQVGLIKCIKGTTGAYICAVAVNAKAGVQCGVIIAKVNPVKVEGAQLTSPVTCYFAEAS